MAGTHSVAAIELVSVVAGVEDGDRDNRILPIVVAPVSKSIRHSQDVSLFELVDFLVFISGPPMSLAFLAFILLGSLEGLESFRAARHHKSDHTPSCMDHDTHTCVACN